MVNCTFWRLATVFALAAFIIAVFPAVAAPALAEDLDELAKEANTELRTAQRSFFSSKYDEAAETLTKVAKILEKITEADPDYSKLKSLKQRYARLKSDVDRRLKKSSTKKPATTPAPEKKAPAAPGAKLPGGVTYRLKKIYDILDKGKPGDPFKLMEEIEKRYGSQIPAGHPEIIAIKARLAELKRTNEAAAKAKAEAAATDKEAREKKEALCGLWTKKLGVFVDFRGSKYLITALENIRATDEQKTKRTVIYREAAAAFAAYQKTPFPHGKTSQLLDIERRLTERLKDFEKDENRAAVKAGSAQWLKKLRQYTDRYDLANERVNKKYLRVPATQDIKELNHLKAVYEEAKATFAAYQKAEFPKGKSDELKVIEHELKDLLAEFPNEYEKNALRVMANPGKALNDTAARLAKDTTWINDRKALPLILGKDHLQALQKLVEKAASLGSAGDGSVAALKEKLAAIRAEDDKRRTVRTERTFMTADRFKGSEITALKTKALEIVKKKVPGSKPLRTTVISPAWKEESVWEWTDTSRTAIRHRVTRSLSAQVAGKLGGAVSRYTIHIAKDRQADGTWGQLYGHIMFTDPMLEKNVTK